MKEAHDKASASAAAMGFLVGAPTSASSTHYTEGSLDPFIVDLGMLSIMVPAIFEEESVQGLSSRILNVARSKNRLLIKRRIIGDVPGDRLFGCAIHSS